MRTSLRLLFLTAIFIGCAHHPLQPPPPSDRLFPLGTYQHAVKIQTLPPNSRTMEMRGVVSALTDQIKVIGLSTFNTTVFRIEENLKTGEIKKQFYLDVIQQHEGRFMEFYKMIRTLIYAQKGTTDFTENGAHFVITQPDAQGIYRHIHVEHPQFILDIEVTGYEF